MLTGDLYVAVQRSAETSDRITLPPSNTLVMLGFVLAVLLLIFGRPLFALGCVLATVMFAGIAAIAQTAPSVLAGVGVHGFLAAGAVLVLPAVLGNSRSSDDQTTKGRRGVQRWLRAVGRTRRR